MKCCNCPALETEGYEYPESYCALGVQDEDTIEYADGESGCKRRSYKKIERDLIVQNEIECEHLAKEVAFMVEYFKLEVPNDY